MCQIEMYIHHVRQRGNVLAFVYRCKNPACENFGGKNDRAAPNEKPVATGESPASLFGGHDPPGE
jgi:hypothetical protein